MSSNSTPQPEQSILSDRDVNTSLTNSSATSSTVEKDVGTKPQPKMAGQATDMDYHRRVLQSKLDEESGKQTYVSPSDGIMSPCTAKLSALKHKHYGKVKPQSLFGKKSGMSTTVSADAPELLHNDGTLESAGI
ncbi:MAG: hypothetical protein M1824_005047 [Vezdaea acicularis]|nr:MAG: hypothetical protein M1824_005047 [Vezdaea acicularis]